MWVRDHQPEVFKQIYKVLQCKDYIALFLTGVFATDYSDASLTQLLDIERRTWAGYDGCDWDLSAGLDARSIPRLCCHRWRYCRSIESDWITAGYPGGDWRR
jgi:xylulokinase